MPEENKKTFQISVPIQKVDEEKRLVYGWASVIEENGIAVVDKQDEVIELDELTKAVHEFMEIRRAKTMHVGKATGTIVESIIFSNDIQKALGIDLKKVGWFIGVKVHDEESWKLVKDGTLKAFSIGGYALKEDVD